MDIHVITPQGAILVAQVVLEREHVPPPPAVVPQTPPAPKR